MKPRHMIVFLLFFFSLFFYLSSIIQIRPLGLAKKYIGLPLCTRNILIFSWNGLYDYWRLGNQFRHRMRILSIYILVAKTQMWFGSWLLCLVPRIDSRVAFLKMLENELFVSRLSSLKCWITCDYPGALVLGIEVTNYASIHNGKGICPKGLPLLREVHCFTSLRIQPLCICYFMDPAPRN